MSDLYQTQWQGWDAWALENSTLRIVTIPELGAKLVSLLDKRNQLEWLAAPGERPLNKAPYGATFTDQDMSGWDDMFPTIVACDYPGTGDRHAVALPDHGEVWTMPWSVEKANEGTLTLSVSGQALPYRLRRSLAFNAANVLQLSYQVDNLGQDALPFLWAAHPQFACGLDTEIVLPAHVNQVCNTLPASWGWGEPETRFGWPEALRPDGSPRRLDRVGPPELHRARKFFVPPEITAGWASLVRLPEGDWLRMAWEADIPLYLGVWVDEGALNSASVAAIEPMTGFYDSLMVAWEKNLVSILGPSARASWRLTVQTGVGAQAN